MCLAYGIKHHCPGSMSHWTGFVHLQFPHESLHHITSAHADAPIVLRSREMDVLRIEN